MKLVKIAVIGAGWIGSCHSLAYANVVAHYGTEIDPVLELVADTSEEQAKKVAERYGFNRWTVDVNEAVQDPDIDIVLITTPNQFHVGLVCKAAEAGKAIFCEKPLGMNAADAKIALDAVKKNKSLSMVGFVYIHNPAIAEAKRIIESGEIGEIVSFQGHYEMEYCCDPDAPHRWRDYDEVSGALGDIGAHMLAISNYVTGLKIRSVVGMGRTIYNKRPDPVNPDKLLPVENDDLFHALYKLENDAFGILTTTRVAPGEKVGIRFEVQCTKGAVRFDQERMNELDVYYASDGRNAGFRNIKMGPQHGDFGYFAAAQALNISWQDLMCIQAHKFLEAVVNGQEIKPDIESAYEVNVLLDALFQSDRENKWVDVIY